MIIRKLRLQKGWSQEQLARLSDLSVSTIQWAERGRKPGLESLKALAAVLEVDLKSLTKGNAMNIEKSVSLDEQKAIEYVRDIKGFYSHLSIYIVIMVFLLVINILFSSHVWWVIWPVLGWGVGVLAHGASVFLGPEWEKKQVEKRLGKKL